MPYSKTKLESISKLVSEVGVEEAAIQLGILKRTVVKVLRVNKKEVSEQKIKEWIPTGFLKKIGEIYTDSELKAISQGGRILPGLE